MDINLRHYTAGAMAGEEEEEEDTIEKEWEVVDTAALSPSAGRDVQPALVIGRHYMTERGSAPVQYSDIV